MIHKIENKNTYTDNLAPYGMYLLDTKPNKHGTFDLCRFTRDNDEYVLVWTSLKGKYRKYVKGRYIEVNRHIMNTNVIYGSHGRISIPMDVLIQVKGHVKNALHIKAPKIPKGPLND